jgi:hypothetical protein
MMLGDANNPLYERVVALAKRTKTKPFKQAIAQVAQVLASTELSPLEKLHQLQSLPIQEWLDKHEKELQHRKKVVLGAEEKLDILTYVICQAKAPDLPSQLELMTAFTTPYMQDGQDSPMSQAYLNLLACTTRV